MNILLVTDSYPPEIRSAAHLMQELAEELFREKHVVTVVTCYPRHNLAGGSTQAKFDEVLVENGVNVVRVDALPVHNIAFILRGIAQLLMPGRFIKSIRKLKSKKIDIVIVYSPPLTLAKVGKFVKEKYGAKFILNIQDIFPQNAIDLGIIKNRLLISMFEGIEFRAYRSADKIAVHSRGNKLFLINKKFQPEEKVEVLHNWIDPLPYISARRTGSFREKYGLQGKFIFLFAGVIGPSQGLEFLIQTAALLKENQDIRFLIVGDGMQKNKLMKSVVEQKLNNVIFQPFVVQSEYPLLVKDADAGLVCLSSMNKTPVVPGKVLGFMAAGLPVLALLNKESDGHILIKDAQCGYAAVSNDPQEAARIILSMHTEKNLIQLGANGFNYLLKNFTKEICIKQLEGMF
ncbi:MAG: glycosyltransferase family 4 protein [Candidatus Omnitrophica bacterium]|nr:glycosyltransferase family 4 protein [Candidatus Omnitrophota bacterium]